MRIKKPYLLILLGCFITCSACITDNQKRYEEAKKIFSESLINFFPKSVDNNTVLQRIIYPDATYANCFSGIFVIQKYSTKEFDEKSKFFKTKAVEIQSAKDSCNLIVSKYGRLDYGNKYKNYLDSIQSKCQKFDLPRPNFNIDGDTLIQANDLNNTFILILAAKKGKYLKEENLTEGKGLPDEWKNGYSSGINLNNNKNEITYWVILW